MNEFNKENPYGEREDGNRVFKPLLLGYEDQFKFQMTPSMLEEHYRKIDKYGKIEHTYATFHSLFEIENYLKPMLNIANNEVAMNMIMDGCNYAVGLKGFINANFKNNYFWHPKVHAKNKEFENLISGYYITNQLPRKCIYTILGKFEYCYDHIPADHDTIYAYLTRYTFTPNYIPNWADVFIISQDVEGCFKQFPIVYALNSYNRYNVYTQQQEVCFYIDFIIGNCSYKWSNIDYNKSRNYGEFFASKLITDRLPIANQNIRESLETRCIIRNDYV